ncbi:response regulator [Lysobacter pythonis]|uniref:Response regulator n=1 Tax=Solilutibacter pythonis TaxID=2483112 RepID=A0A3M2HY82_9GAMM|nr:response regulator [Lysobacter pythonis]RMH90794.1 response regulator [Lysobacter pythonis]
MTTPCLRILLIEDSADDAELITIELAQAGLDFELHRVELRTELEAALECGDWALAICDSRLPGFNGIDAYAQVRERLPSLPFIFCIGGPPDDPCFATAAASADACISKDRLSQLPATVLGVLAA